MTHHFTALLILPRNIDFIVHDPVRDLGGEVEDGVLVWLDGLGGVDDEDKARAFVREPDLSASGRLRRVHQYAPAATTSIAAIIGLE